MTKKPDAAHETALSEVSIEDFSRFAKWLGTSHVIVANNDEPKTGHFSAAELVAMEAMVTRLERLEEAIRARPCAAAIAALRAHVDFELLMDGEPADRLHAHAADILLDMLANIAAVPA